MNTDRMLCILSIGCAALMGLQPATAAETPGARKAPAWKVGDAFHVEVTLYGRDWTLAAGSPEADNQQKKDEDRVVGRYDVTITVTGVTTVAGIACWQLEYAAGTNAPPGVRGQEYRTCVSQEDGAMKRLSREAGEEMGNPELQEVNGSTVLKDAPYGFPLETIQWKSAKPTASQNPDTRGQSATRKETLAKDAWLVEQTVQEGKTSISTVRQKWNISGTWWTEYEKIVGGRREIHARWLGK